MPFGLTIGTERAHALQVAIQNELTKRGYSPDADPVMAEYITIMVINNKTPALITSELEDLIGTDFDPNFTEWLFLEAAKGASNTLQAASTEALTSVAESVSSPPTCGQPLRQIPPHVPSDSSRRQPNPHRAGVYQQAISQVLPSSSGQKRQAPARSPSPSNLPSKTRKMDVPTGPRAMYRDSLASQSNPKSLLDRVGGHVGTSHARGNNNVNGGSFVQDEVQNRIDNILNNSPDMMISNGFNSRMDVSPIGTAGMAANPMVLQEMMMNQMALMAQMASSMGMMNSPSPFVGVGFSPLQGGSDMGMFQGGVNNGFQGLNGSGMHPSGRGRGSGRGGGRGGGPSGRGRCGSTSFSSPSKIEPVLAVNDATTVATIPVVPTGGTVTAVPTSMITQAQPTPIVVPSLNTQNAQTVLSSMMPATAMPQHIPYAVPERPQSPTLCKFSTKCTNPHCRYAHPSPVATVESGVVLSNESCEKGKDCQDKDCIKGHISPSVLNPQLVSAIEQSQPLISNAHPVAVQNGIPCRFGAACARLSCSFVHSGRSADAMGATIPVQQCRFGAGCTRAKCLFQHPDGRVLPTSFHRGLTTKGPMVTVPSPETGTMGSTTSPHKSVTFNQPSSGGMGTGLGQGVKEKMQQQLKEIEERKKEAEKAVREAEAAAATTGSDSRKKDESKPVAIAA